MNKAELLHVVREFWHSQQSQKPFVKGKTIVPVSGASITADDIVAVVSAVLEGWFTEWKIAQKFSASLENFLGIRHVILCNSGSSANLLAMASCRENFKSGSRKYVVTCATGFPTTIAVILQLGCIPLFVDINPKTLNPDVDVILECLWRKNVAGVIQAHTLGLAIREADKLAQTCASMEKFYIEDASNALGGRSKYGNLGSIGTASTFSFFPAHQICAGEGGAVGTNDDKLAESIRSYANWGRACYCLPGQDNTCGKRFSQQFGTLPYGYDHKYTFERLGYNLKITEIQAALGLSQFGRLHQFTEARQGNYRYLFDNLIPLVQAEKIVLYPLEEESPFGFPLTVRVDSSFPLRQFLEERGIRTRPVFAGNITRHPMGISQHWESCAPLIGSDYVMEHTFWVGCHPGLSQEMLDWIVESIFDFFFRAGG